LIFLALQTYKNLERNLLVLQSFVVPNDDDTWPIKTWGMKLGKVVSNIRNKNNYADHRQRLESIGFDYTSQSSSYGYDVVESALLTYKDLKGYMLVPVSFVVPNDDDTWPIETWGMKLGGVVMSIRNNNAYADHRQRLESIGFDYTDQSLDYGYDVIEPALLTYKDLKGDMLVPVSFVVPNDDDTWPIETWGMKLGRIVSDVRNNNAYADHRQRLESIGFDYTDQRYRYEVIEPALLTYKDLKGGMLVPVSFVVPNDNDTWPIKTWGMKLGYVVKNIRNNNAYADHRQRLESIGFDYTCQLEEHHSEMKCREIFQEIYFPSAFDKAYPQWLISPTTSRSLQLNGYNEDLKIAFEYRGKQHQTLSYYNDFDKDSLASLQVRDSFKESECALRGIKLIIITSEYTYEDPIALKKFIISELTKHGKFPLS
jgi:virulence-associated protein VapD